MFLSLSSFSQIVTKPVINDSIVRIPKNIADSIARELNEKDRLVTQNYLLKKDTSTLGKIVVLQKKDLSLFKQKEEAYISIGADYKKTIANYDVVIASQEKKLKNSKLKTTISQILLVALGVFTITKL